MSRPVRPVVSQGDMPLGDMCQRNVTQRKPLKLRKVRKPIMSPEDVRAKFMALLKAKLRARRPVSKAAVPQRPVFGLGNR